MRELKILGGFFLFVALIATSIYAGYSVGKTEQSRALQGCEVVATQAVKDNETQANEYYNSLNEYQEKLQSCDELLKTIEELGEDF